MVDDDLRTATWVTYAGGRASGMRVRRCRVTVVGGPDRGLVQDIDDSEIHIGARPGNHVQLSDAKVSGSHCKVSLDESGYRLYDLGSTNGTYAGDLRINDAYIPPGTVISVGDTRLSFEPQVQSVERPLSSSDRFGSMVGASVVMRELFARLDKLARSDVTVLITGETGVGKELVAESLHQNSDRADGPFVVLDCGAIASGLIESQLFGHERGAFTGATSTRPGVFERAHGGTVFLDEIGELPTDMQPKLLRVLERHRVRRVGGQHDIEADFRVLAATHRNLAVMINHGQFREDLYYRLAVARVHVPPLRERPHDIPLLAEHLLGLLPGGGDAYLSDKTMAAMQRHHWPGNVRELRNAIERALSLDEPPISIDTREPGGAGAAQAHATSGGDAATGEHALLTTRVDPGRRFKVAKQELVSEFERRYVTLLLRAHDGNVSQAARAAGLDRNSLHKILRRLDLDNPGR